MLCTLVRTRPGLWSLMCSSVAAMSISFTPNVIKNSSSITNIFFLISINLNLLFSDDMDVENSQNRSVEVICEELL